MLRSLAVAAAAGLLTSGHGTAAATDAPRPDARVPSAAAALVNPYAADEVPVLIVLGQSNAMGVDRMTNAADIQKCSTLTAVRGLDVARNRVAGAAAATWGPFSCSEMNLGSSEVSGVHNVANHMALRWQRAIDAGAPLPDLHIIQVSRGSQGFLATDAPDDRWRIDRDPSNVESLHPLALNTISNALRQLQVEGKVPRIVGMHWNQWEQESLKSSATSVQQIQTAFEGVLRPLRIIAGGGDFPIFLYRPRATVSPNPTSTQHIITAITNLTSQAEPNPFELIDAANAVNSAGTPLFAAGAPSNYGIFSDSWHYLPAVQMWFAQVQWDSIFTAGRHGAPVTSTTNAALRRPATQSSTYSASLPAPASLAVDGNTDGAFLHGSVTHTNIESSPWWQVDLGTVQRIRDVRIANRTDIAGERLANFTVFVSTTDPTGRSLADLKADPNVARYHVGGTAGANVTAPIGASGRHVRIQLDGTNALSLAEVRVDVEP